MRSTLLTIILFISFSLSAKELAIMSYNAHNLFDTNHDKNKNDWTYLPLRYPKKIENCKKMRSAYRRKECLDVDWSDKKLSVKLEQINKVINLDKRPDILGLVEVENTIAVSALMSKLGYSRFVMTESPDHRGIDVALMFNETKDLKFVSMKEHVLAGNSSLNKPTRNILEVEFLLDSSLKLYVFVNHWPSLSNPDENRVNAAQALKSRIDYLSSRDANASFIAMGDFNTIDELKPGSKTHPFRDVLLKDNSLIDIDQNVRSKLSSKKRLSMAKGTYFYKRNKEWSLLDRFFVSSNIMDNGKIRYIDNSYKIIDDRSISIRYSKTGEYIPHSFNHRLEGKNRVGFSDHYPIIMSVKY